MTGLLLCIALVAQGAWAADGATWQDRLAADLVADPDRARLIWEAQPITTRNGYARFVDDAFGGPEAAPFILDRYLHKGEDSGLRVALVEALERTRGDWAEALVSALPDEADPWVRATIVSSLTHAEAAPAALGVRLGAVDVDPDVRAAAMRVIAGRPDMGDRVDLVLAGLADGDAAVRTAATRAVGWRGMASAWGAVVALMDDPDANVQVGALRALDRLDTGRAAGLPRVRSLTQSPDHRVAAAAQRITAE